MVGSVVILIVNILNVGARKSETNAPVATHAHGPSTLPATFQRVQAETRQGHVAWFDCHIESAQDQSQLTGVLRLDPDRDSTQEEALQPLMSEAEYGHACIVACNVSGYNECVGLLIMGAQGESQLGRLVIQDIE
jgi:hypothetical protein